MDLKCPKCRSSFFNRYSLGKHYLDVHLKNVKSMKVVDVKRNIPRCTRCGEEFESKKDLDEHTDEKHGGEVPESEVEAKLRTRSVLPAS